MFLGNYLMQSGEPAKAISEFQLALEDAPQNTAILLGMADAYSASQKYEEARKILDRLLKENPKNVDALIRKAELLVAQSEAAGSNKQEVLQEAVETLQQARRIQPRNMDVLKGLAAAYIGLQDLDKIIQAYRDIVRVNPRDIQATLVLANVLADTGRVQEAISLYERVIEERRGFITTYLFLGQLYEKLRQFDNAIATYERALVIDPRSEKLRVRYENALLRKHGEENRTAVLERYAQLASKYPHSSGIQRLYAERLLSERDFARAVEQFRRVVEVDPENLESLIALSQLLIQQRQYEEARKYLEHAVEIDPARVDAYASLAETYVAEGEKEKAVEVYRKALRLNPDSEKLLLALGELLSRTGDPQQAIQTLLDTTSATATRPEFLAVIGQAYERARDFEKALEYYQRAHEKAPNTLAVIAKLFTTNLRLGRLEDADALLTRIVEEGMLPKDDLYALVGEAYLTEGYPEKATESYQKAFQANPDSLKLLVRLVELNNLRDEHQANFRLLEQVTGSLAGTDEIQELRAQTFLDMKKYDEALEIYRKLQQAHPSSDAWVETLADAYIAAKKYDEALALVRRNENLLGKQRANQLRGIIQYKARRFAQAEKTFRALLTGGAESLAESSSYHYYLGSIYLDQQKYDKAEEAFRKAIELDPTNDSALNALGYMLADRNIKLTEARDLIEKALSLRPNGPHILDSMGWVLYRMGRYEEALDYIQRSHRMMGDDAEILEHLGDVYMKLGQGDKAQEMYRRAYKLDSTRPGLASKVNTTR